jgi:hypothetical protein
LEGAHLILFWLALVAYGAEAGFRLAGVAPASIWAYYAWGSYWIWTPKEIWSVIVWIYFATLTHLKFIPAQERWPGWTKRLEMGATAAGYGVVRTNEPLFHEGYGIYIKHFGTTPWGAPYAVFDANRDPGATAILAASLLFTVANLLYLIPRPEERCVSRCRCEQGT